MYKVVGRLKLYRAKVFPGQSHLWTEVFSGPKCALGQSMLQAKESVGPKLSLGQTRYELIMIDESKVAYRLFLIRALSSIKCNQCGFNLIKLRKCVL